MPHSRFIFHIFSEDVSSGTCLLVILELVAGTGINSDKLKRFDGHGSKRTTIKYGPFQVSPARLNYEEKRLYIHKMVVKADVDNDDRYVIATSIDTRHGMKSVLQMSATKPCSECLITSIQAGLKYPNGS
ncbi:uncharacterized protein K441DRAFT_15363 [Cenococcum geophilum 1.58]|uniref:uncharacterized protein n=1 Tax=Cenococcum geophilum 1.58 TaxID=794803 RepID=UPI00358F9FF8|nr:hypothetical protein K441DRAFT_15363 [Cenococcum geophilum 1.58]